MHGESNIGGEGARQEVAGHSALIHSLVLLPGRRHNLFHPHGPLAGGGTCGTGDRGGRANVQRRPGGLRGGRSVGKRPPVSVPCDPGARATPCHLAHERFSVPDCQNVSCFVAGDNWRSGGVCRGKRGWVQLSKEG